MISGSNIGIRGGTFINHNHTSKGMDILKEWVATGAFHNSDELYDAPECHARTRLGVLADIMQWVNDELDYGRKDFVLWFFGPAGAGKSAIAKRIAEMAAESDLLIADFFFSRTSPTRNTKDRLIATLAYQLAVSIPDTRSYIEEAIERDPVIFNKNIPTQIDTLLIKPISSAQIYLTPKKLIIIDGLDECNDSQAQVAILEAISRTFSQLCPPIKFLIVSRPETDLMTLFNCGRSLKNIHRRLALDDTYRPDDDIRLFLCDKFQQIRLTHPLRATIPISWPTQGTLETLVEKSSGQFIYASTVVKFVESSRHRPTARLNIILGISPPGTLNPFAELDELYNHLLSSVDDIQITLRVLSLYVMTPHFVTGLRISMSPELFLSLEPGDIHLSLINLSSIVSYHESSGVVEILHASFVDFLSDKHRSTTFYIDMASTCTDFVHRIHQYVKGPDGIQAGDIRLFDRVMDLSPWISKGELRTDILNFDLDAFINASIKLQYQEHPIPFSGSTIEAFRMWKKLLTDAGLEDGDKTEALDRLNKSFDSRLEKYQSDWRLKLLLTLAVTDVVFYEHQEVPSCRCLDILLEMDDHDLHLADQRALDLRHAYVIYGPRLIDMISSSLDGDTYASAALHCMRFLSNPPKYADKDESPEIGPKGNVGLEMGLIYTEWKATCDITLQMLCKLLQQANASPELVQFIINHDIHSEVKDKFSTDRVWEITVHILSFLSRAGVCANWRIISAIQQSLIITRRKPSDNAQSDENEERKVTWHIMRQRLDRCCSNVH